MRIPKDKLHTHYLEGVDIDKIKKVGRDDETLRRYHSRDGKTFLWTENNIYEVRGCLKC